MEKEHIDQVISKLEHLLKGPQKFLIEENNPQIATSFLSGFRVACFLLFNDLHITFLQAREIAVRKRGHKYTAQATWKELKEEGYDSEQIVKELILIEIETWKLLRDN